MRSYQNTYEVSDYNYFQGIQPAILAVLLFLFILHLNLDNIPNILKKYYNENFRIVIRNIFSFVYF